jgi:hypothetical protein
MLLHHGFVHSGISGAWGKARIEEADKGRSHKWSRLLEGAEAPIEGETCGVNNTYFIRQNDSYLVCV